MRIALAQINLHVGNFSGNLRKILNAIKHAQSLKVDLVVFPELTVCGYPPRDLLYSEAFIDGCMNTVNAVAKACNGIGAIIGSPTRNNKMPGKSLYNSALLLFDGKVQDVYNKGLLPTYDVFNEYRYFEPATTFKTVLFNDKRIALTVCEDLWNIDEQGMYRVNPPDVLIKEKPDFLINISASPFAWDHRAERFRILCENAMKFGIPVFSTNLVGGQTDLLFDGASAVCTPDGRLYDTLPAFEESMQVYELNTVLKSSGIKPPEIPDDSQKHMLMKQAVVMGIRDYFAKSGVDKAILGLSGGIDSALTLVLAAEAIGPENLWAILLPGPYSSKHSITDAQALANKLGVKHNTISINEIVNSFEHSLEPFFLDSEPGIAEENIQARARAVVLMGLSNKFGYMLLNTSNKSEAAVGYTTLYGDMCGGLSVIGDVYKTDVYGMANLINHDEEIIPDNTIIKPPSAELKPNQKDSDSLPEYKLLDDILFLMLEKQKDINDIIDAGYEKNIVERIAKMLQASEYKRRQSPPILRVSAKCLGVGREMPIEAKHLSGS